MGVSTIRRVFVCERLFEMEPYHLKKDGTVLHSDWLGVDFSLPVYQYKDTGVYFVRTEEQALLDIIDEYYEEIFDCERPDFYEEDILEIVEGEPWWYPEGQHIVSTGYSMEEVKKIFPLIKEHFMCANYESGYDDFVDGGYFYEKAEQAMSYDREYSYGEESIWHAAGYRADAKTDENTRRRILRNLYAENPRVYNPNSFWGYYKDLERRNSKQHAVNARRKADARYFYEYVKQLS